MKTSAAASSAACARVAASSAASAPAFAAASAPAAAPASAIKPKYTQELTFFVLFPQDAAENVRVVAEAMEMTAFCDDKQLPSPLKNTTTMMERNGATVKSVLDLGKQRYMELEVNAHVRWMYIRKDDDTMIMTHYMNHRARVMAQSHESFLALEEFIDPQDGSRKVSVPAPHIFFNLFPRLWPWMDVDEDSASYSSGDDDDDEDGSEEEEEPTELKGEEPTEGFEGTEDEDEDDDDGEDDYDDDDSGLVGRGCLCGCGSGGPDQREPMEDFEGTEDEDEDDDDDDQP